MGEIAGCTCPLGYRHGAEAIARLPAAAAETLYGWAGSMAICRPSIIDAFRRANVDVFIRYNQEAWQARFLANRPEGSPAWLS